MFKKFDGIIVDEVICYEETVKMKLPKDYKEFLLDTNGVSLLMKFICFGSMN